MPLNVKFAMRLLNFGRSSHFFPFPNHAHYRNIITQLMRLSKLEPEPLLQPDLHLLGNVATKRLGDLWQLDHRLHQQDNRAAQTQLPKLFGR